MTVRHIIYQAKPSLIFGIVKSDILMSMINRVVSASNTVKTFQLNKICRIPYAHYAYFKKCSTVLMVNDAHFL